MSKQKTEREIFVDELQQRIQDKNHKEIADGIVWAIEQLILRNQETAGKKPVGKIPEA